MTAPDRYDEQRTLAATAHPLQRVGAFAFARLVKRTHPGEVTPAEFDSAVATMTGHAVDAALVRDTKKPEGFWLKCSMSLFPNSKMNHLSNARRDDQEIRERVEQWRRMPEPDRWPDAACVLCGRPAVGWYGKVDVPLAESDLYRNTTPRGYDGMALCWPCVCSFYALPYGCQLTGGPSTALHSWDDRFLAAAVARQVSHNLRVITAAADPGTSGEQEVTALRALRDYEQRLRAGVELLVFNNNNRGQSLTVHRLDQPLAEWLRAVARDRRVTAALERAHRTEQIPGVVQFARNAFRSPERIVGRCADYLTTAALDGRVHPDAEPLADANFSYSRKVMRMDDNDLDEIRATGDRIAIVLKEAGSGGKLNEFYARTRSSKDLRMWLRQQAVSWALNPPVDSAGPLVTTRGFNLLFNPDVDSNSWYYRQLLLIAVLEQLHLRDWRPDDGSQAVEELEADESAMDSDEEGQVS